MTNMRRVTIPLTDDIDGKLLDLKGTERFRKKSYSEVVRCVLQKGLDCIAAGTAQATEEGR